MCVRVVCVCESSVCVSGVCVCGVCVVCVCECGVCVCVYVCVCANECSLLQRERDVQVPDLLQREVLHREVFLLHDAKMNNTVILHA